MWGYATVCACGGNIWMYRLHIPARRTSHGVAEVARVAHGISQIAGLAAERFLCFPKGFPKLPVTSCIGDGGNFAMNTV